MKKLITLLILSSQISACGFADQFAKDCGGEFESLCHALFGQTPSQVAALEDDVAKIKAQIKALESQNSLLINQATMLQNLISIVDVQNQAAIQNLATNLSNVEAQLAANVAQIAVLNGFQHVTEIIDPCGDHPTKYDEVLLKIYRPSTNSYAILASFSDNASGLNTRFSIVPQGSYVATDGTNCAFQVGPAPNFNVTW